MRLLIAISFLLGLAWLNAQPSVNLYLEPEDDAIVFQRAPLTRVEALSPEHPVVDGEVDEDWMRVKYDGHYIGFVEAPEANDDGTFNPGAKLYMRSYTDSPVIANIQYGDRATIIDRTDGWVTVDFRGKGRVYYRNPLKFPPSTAPAPAVAVSQVTRTAPVAPAAPSSPAPGAGVTTMRVTPATPADGGEIFAFEDTVPAAARPSSSTTIATPPPPAAPPASSFTQPGAVASSSLQPQILRRDVPRRYEGTFKRVSGFDFNWFGPDYDFALDDANGKRIAYIDVDGTLLFSPVESYFDQPVVIEGTAEKIGGTVPLLIKAKFMRLKK